MSTGDREAMRAKRAKRTLDAATWKVVGWCCLALGAGGFLMILYLVLDLFIRFSRAEAYFVVLQVAPVWLLLGLVLCILPGLRTGK